MLPRVYPLVLGELDPRPPSAKTQGKAGNQLGALRFLPATTISVVKWQWNIVELNRPRLCAGPLSADDGCEHGCLLRGGLPPPRPRSFTCATARAQACKVPFVLRHFQPPGCDRRSVASNRRATRMSDVFRTVQARIIGFREHIFTGSHGAVGGHPSQRSCSGSRMNLERCCHG